jgi:hypothetical protein
MKIVRNIAAVIVGYLIFAGCAVLLFKLAGIDPHAEAGLGTMLLVIVFGAVFSFVAGFVAKAIAASPSLGANVALAVLIFVFAAFSAGQSSGSHYTQFAAMAIFSQVSLLGAHFSKKVLSQS